MLFVCLFKAENYPFARFFVIAHFNGFANIIIKPVAEERPG